MSETYFRQTVQNLLPNPGAEMLRYGWRKPSVLSLGQGEGSDPTPDFIINAAHRAMAEGKTHYGPVLGQLALREAITAYYKKIFAVDLESNQVFVTGSGTTAMHLALTSVLDPQDEVVAITPIWKNLLGAVGLAQAHTRQVGLNFDVKTGWSLDMDRLFDAVTAKTKAILIVTPSNPTGWMMSLDEMQSLLSFTREKGIWIISDEVYNRSAYGLNHAPSFLQVAKPDDLLLTVNSFSKAWAMTGWRLGWLTGPAFAETVIRDIALYDNMGPPTFTQFGGIAALEQGEPFIKAQRTSWQRNKQTIMNRLSLYDCVTIHDSASTFYAFFKVRGEEDCLDFGKRLIDEAELSLAPGCAFGAQCRGWMRLCFAVSQTKLNDALDRLERVLPS